MIGKEVDSSQRSFEQLNMQDAYKLQGIQELEQLRKAMWFGQFNASNLVFVFPPEEITSVRFPPLNRTKNLFFVGTLNGMGSTDILNILNHFDQFCLRILCIYFTLTHPKRIR